MKRSAIILIALFAVTATAKDDEKEKAIKQEKEKLKGRWKMTAVDSKGQEIAPKFDKFIVIEGDKWRLEMPGKDGKIAVKAEFEYHIDPTQSPKAIDISIHQVGKGKDAFDKAIYKLDKDTLIICSPQTRGVGQDGSRTRPKEFKTTDGEAIYTYKRVDK